MSDNLTNPLQTIKAKTLQGWSGCIEVREPKDISISWRIYLLSGKIQYATSTAGQQERLNCLWQQFQIGKKCPTIIQHKSESEYRQLSQWLSKKGTMDFQRKHLFSFTQEAIVRVCSIEQAPVKLIADKHLENVAVSFTIDDLENQASSDRWQKVRTYLDSPFSRLHLEQSKALQFYKIWKEFCKLPELSEQFSYLKLSSFVNLFTFENSLYQIAAQANIDCLLLAEYLKSSIDKQILTTLPYKKVLAKSSAKLATFQNNVSRSLNRSPAKKRSQPTIDDNSERPIIVCIDDSKTVQRQVKMTLEAINYQVINIYEPEQALKQLLRQQPVLILMDINMPNINGYDLCSMLRKSNKFKTIPIVMLTGRDGAIDRIRAKFVGSTDYLTKPFVPEQLVEMVQKYCRFSIGQSR